jgi:hypothetical protein
VEKEGKNRLKSFSQCLVSCLFFSLDTFLFGGLLWRATLSVSLSLCLSVSLSLCLSVSLSLCLSVSLSLYLSLSVFLYLFSKGRCLFHLTPNFPSTLSSPFLLQCPIIQDYFLTSVLVLALVIFYSKLLTFKG